MGKIIELKNIFKYYGKNNTKFAALDNINLSLNEGEFLCILGESGSGKSTLLNIISCLDKPSSGEVIFKNSVLNNHNDKYLTDFRAKEIGFVFQFFNLLDEIDVYKNLTVIPNSYQEKNKVEQILNLVGLKNKINKYPRELSGGEQQRVSIARALNKPSSLLLCDEPTGALDYKTGKEILKLLEDIHKKTNKTIVIVTHTKEISKICDRVITLKSGKIISNKVNKTIVKSTDIDW